MRHLTLAALLGAALLAGCGGDDQTAGDRSTSAPATAARAAQPVGTVAIEEFLFVPASPTVKAGQRIEVPNRDAAPHTLTEQRDSGAPLFDTGNVRGRQTGSFVAPEPGTYAFYCELHAFMKGELRVVE